MHDQTEHQFYSIMLQVTCSLCRSLQLGTRYLAIELAVFYVTYATNGCIFKFLMILGKSPVSVIK